MDRPGNERPIVRRGSQGSPRSRSVRVWKAWVDFSALAVLGALAMVGGGSSFADAPSLLYVRPAAVVALAIFALTPAPVSWATMRAPLLMLAALAAIMLVQLVPLPPGWWTALPGRAPYAALAATAGIAQPWRPLSLTPDLTANSLAALVVPATALVGAAKLMPDQRRLLVIGLVALCCASAVLGVGQLAGGAQSVLYLYRRTYPGFAVGFLANRNHQAALLAIAMPALRCWSLMPAAGRAAARRRAWLALGLGIALLPATLATGSRAGLLLVAASLVSTFLVFPVASARDGQARSGRVWLIRCGIVAVAALPVGFSYVLDRAASINRLGSAPALAVDVRFQSAPLVMRISGATFPVGTGFGSFDPVFRQYEPDAGLTDSYLNHAHNELLELAMTAGVPGLLLLAAFLGWWGWRLLVALRARGGGPDWAQALLGGIVIGVLLAASLVDYPLRTPLLELVFAVACGWLAAPGGFSPPSSPPRELLRQGMSDKRNRRIYH